jgi:hypothetical protein
MTSRRRPSNPDDPETRDINGVVILRDDRYPERQSSSRGPRGHDRSIGATKPRGRLTRREARVRIGEKGAKP